MEETGEKRGNHRFGATPAPDAEEAEDTLREPRISPERAAVTAGPGAARR